MAVRHQILVVDDDEEDHLIMQEYFKDLGTEEHVAFVKNGKLALNHLGLLTDHLFPNLIVLDLNMPVMNGTQTLMELKRNPRLKNIPVIIFSTSENETEKQKSLSLGALDYFVKPSNYAQGLKIIERMNQFIVKQIPDD